MHNIIRKFPQKNIAVIGDIILDKYIFGDVDRISPEAPVPIVRVKSQKYVPGGAANVAANITTLGGNALLFGITGDDSDREILLDSLEENKINISGVLIDSAKRTTKKTRILGLNQQLLRIDFEDTEYIESNLENEFLTILKKSGHLDAVVISDYAKGTITSKLMEAIKSFCNQKKILLLVDPKPKHKFWYHGVDLITPNKNEAQTMCDLQINSNSDYYDAAVLLSDELETNVILTAGAEGMFVYPSPYTLIEPAPHTKPLSMTIEMDITKKAVCHTSKSLSMRGDTTIPSVQHISTEAKEVYDVSGAGDTVVATLALALSAGASLIDAAKLANQAAGIKVGKLGTAVVSYKELMNTHLRSATPR